MVQEGQKGARLALVGRGSQQGEDSVIGVGVTALGRVTTGAMPTIVGIMIETREGRGHNRCNN